MLQTPEKRRFSINTQENKRKSESANNGARFHSQRNKQGLVFLQSNALRNSKTMNIGFEIKANIQFPAQKNSKIVEIK